MASDTPARPAPDLVEALRREMAPLDGLINRALLDALARNQAAVVHDHYKGPPINWGEDLDEARRRYAALLADTLRLLIFHRYTPAALSDYPVLADALKAEEGR